MSKVNESYYRSSDGLKLFYRDYPSQNDGELTPVLCLPGLTRNSLDFVDLATLLSRHRRVITTDLRGRGRSEYDPDRLHYHPGQYVADIWQLLDHLAISKLCVIGTSLGGLMVMLMAHERNSVVCAAVMNDIGPYIEPAGIKRIFGETGSLPVVADWNEAVARVRSVYAETFPDWSDDHWQEYAGNTYAKLNDGRVELQFDQNIVAAARDGLSGLRHELWQLFDALKPTPLLVIRGEKSDILSAATLQKMQQRKPDLTTVVVPNRGHAPKLNEPEAVNAINLFLELN